ncbi:hypothetical protein CC86DRAFT_446968 [Ophiobolus disseminans]|uniref:Uncharacterized protein n=1 Tax=Ophiobolus disseminans TaxID=1469910 RepID=A0A6A6ZV28_9PLEO|nr:hypothetical protein CC86DRAFT_446968 [Ophiobolus disseminans]
MSRRDRALLTQGKLITFIDHRGNNVMEFPLALFHAAFSRKDLLVDNKIVVPQELDIVQVKRLLSLMMKVAMASHVSELPPTENTYVDLQFHSAAEALGMSSFTQNIFGLYFKRVNNKVATVPNIEAIAAVTTPPGNKIFKQMSYKLGIEYFEHKIANRDDFERYLQTNSRLRDAVNEVVAHKQVAVDRQRQNEESRLAFVERERKREDEARYEAQREERNKADKAEKEFEKFKREERKKKDAGFVKAMLEKKRLGQKLNAEEARAHEKHFGKAVPY